MKLYRTIILILALFVMGSVDAQKQKDWIELGDQAYAIGDYYGARHYFENALSMDSAKAALQYKYAETLRNINDYKGAEHQYDKVYRKDRGRFYPLGIFWIAKMNEYNGDYEKAIEFWKKYKSGDDSDMKKSIKQRLKSCEFAKKNKDAVAQYEGAPLDVTNAGRKINSAESEFGLSMIGDSILYYSSLRGDYSDEDVLLENKYNIKIYRSTLKRKFKRFTVGRELGEHINVEEMITANGSFNVDLSLFFYSQCDQDRNCVIMVADHAKGKFTNPRKVDLKINTPNASTTQPNIAKIYDEEHLFFSSNRPGGFGKNDIWFCKIDGENVLGEVQNMGGIINSPDNEISPFYDSDKMGLYFSSDWHEGFGGFDIFYSGGLPLTYTVTPKNLLSPFNSSANDMYFGKTNANEGYLTSNRVGSLGQRGETCCNDIWFFGEPEISDSLL
ncbi:MAG: tetratricopeptide (TPR) repeat protein, partial [Granulosicoccus sp.]